MQAEARGDVPPGTPRVLTGHFTVAGATMGSERSVMLGRDMSVLLSEIADPAWDYVAMGHIHKHQNVTYGRSDLPPVVYSGSMECIDFGEQGDTKGFCWVTLERGHTTWQFVEVHCRPFVTLHVDVRHQADPTGIVIEMIDEHHLEGAIVRVIIRADVETSLDERAIRERLYFARASTVAAIQRDVDRPTRTRLGGSPEGLTEPVLLERYLHAKQVPTERINTLLEHAESIFQNGESGQIGETVGA